MARGTQKIEQNAAAVREKREQAQQSSLPQLYTSHVQPSKGGGPVIVRFCEQGQDVNSFDRHEYHVPDGKGGTYRRLFTCLREAPWNAPACPGCAAGLKIKQRGVYNVIQRNRPVFRLGADKKPVKGPDQKYIVDGYADQVVILDVPSTTAAVLVEKDGTYHGLMGLDLKLSDSGSSFQPWSIEPADIVNALSPMTENDLALLATKHNLDEFMKPPSAEAAQQIVNQYGSVQSAAFGGGGQQAVPPQGNANQVGSPTGFLTGAQVPAGAPGAAFGAATAAVPPPSTVPPVVTPEQGTGSPVVPVAGVHETGPQPSQAQPGPQPVAPAPAPAPVQQ